MTHKLKNGTRASFGGALALAALLALAGCGSPKPASESGLTFVEYEIEPGTFVSLPAAPVTQTGGRDGLSVVMVAGEAGFKYQVSAMTFLTETRTDEEIREVEHRMIDGLQQREGTSVPHIEGESDGLPNVHFEDSRPTRLSLVTIAGRADKIYMLVTQGLEANRTDMQKLVDSLRVRPPKNP